LVCQNDVVRIGVVNGNTSASMTAFAAPFDYNRTIGETTFPGTGGIPAP
jgi:hypothetical protein